MLHTEGSHPVQREGGGKEGSRGKKGSESLHGSEGCIASAKREDYLNYREGKVDGEKEFKNLELSRGTVKRRGLEFSVAGDSSKVFGV